MEPVQDSKDQYIQLSLATKGTRKETSESEAKSNLKTKLTKVRCTADRNENVLCIFNVEDDKLSLARSTEACMLFSA